MTKEQVKHKWVRVEGKMPNPAHHTMVPTGTCSKAGGQCSAPFIKASMTNKPCSSEISSPSSGGEERKEKHLLSYPLTAGQEK